MTVQALNQAVSLSWSEEMRKITIRFGEDAPLVQLRSCVRREPEDIPEALAGAWEAGQPACEALNRLHERFQEVPENFGWQEAADGLIYVLMRWLKVGSCSRVDDIHAIDVYAAHDADPEELLRDIAVLLRVLSM